MIKLFSYRNITFVVLPICACGLTVPYAILYFPFSPSCSNFDDMGQYQKTGIVEDYYLQIKPGGNLQYLKQQTKTVFLVKKKYLYHGPKSQTKKNYYTAEDDDVVTMRR